MKEWRGLIADRTVLVLGGAGLVGRAVCRLLLDFVPKKLIIHSLREHESEMTATYLRERGEAPKKPTEIIPAYGDIFVREEFKILERKSEILDKPERRRRLYADFLDDLGSLDPSDFALYQLIASHRPNIVIDCINTATGIAYQNIYESSRAVRQILEGPPDYDQLKERTELLLCSLYVPQLVRHVQILEKALRDSGTEFYLKIGTSGTGGMGLNIPYTHGEEKPSQTLMSKAAVAGAHTLLLYLMHASPFAPIVREVKPTAAIGWKEIGYGPILYRGKPIFLYDCDPKSPFSCKIGEKLILRFSQRDKGVRPVLNDRKEQEPFRSVYIDTGENGLFSRGEFTAITSLRQMEFVTAEEIAHTVIQEVTGSSTGSDILGAIRASSMGPSYRAGVMRANALKKLKALEREAKHGESIAFEILGPPRLSKLLFEAYLLKLEYSGPSQFMEKAPDLVADAITERILHDRELRCKIVSLGIPILLKDGRQILRGPEIKTPPGRGFNELTVRKDSINKWAENGWVDLRAQNWKRWRQRIKAIRESLATIPREESSSFYARDSNFWQIDAEFNIGEIVGWIFIHEERGARSGYNR